MVFYVSSNDSLAYKQFLNGGWTDSRNSSPQIYFNDISQFIAAAHSRHLSVAIRASKTSFNAFVIYQSTHGYLTLPNGSLAYGPPLKYTPSIGVSGVEVSLVPIVEIGTPPSSTPSVFAIATPTQMSSAKADLHTIWTWRNISSKLSASRRTTDLQFDAPFTFDSSNNYALFAAKYKNGSHSDKALSTYLGDDYNDADLISCG